MYSLGSYNYYLNFNVFNMLCTWPGCCWIVSRQSQCACYVLHVKKQRANATWVFFSYSSVTCRDPPTSNQNLWKKLIITFAWVSLTCLCCLLPPGGMCLAKNYNDFIQYSFAFSEVHLREDMTYRRWHVSFCSNLSSLCASYVFE